MDRLQNVMNRLPSYLDNESQNTRIRTVLGAVLDEMELASGQISRIDSMVGVDDTVGIDIDKRWGALLNIQRQADEVDDIYRNRLKTSVTDMVGGTDEAIKYAVAVALKLSDTQADAQIQVVDSWDYDGDAIITVGNGYSVCIVDLNYTPLDYGGGINQVIIDAVNRAKASGVNVQILFNNYRVNTYDTLEQITYQQTYSMSYDKLGGEE